MGEAKKRRLSCCQVSFVMHFELWLRIIAKQRSELSRANYFRFIAGIPREMLLFIDETAKDKKKLQVNQIQFQNTSREVRGAGSCDFYEWKNFFATVCTLWPSLVLSRKQTGTNHHCHKIILHF